VANRNGPTGGFVSWVGSKEKNAMRRRDVLKLAANAATLARLIQRISPDHAKSA